MGNMISIVVDFIALRIQILKSFVKERDLSIEKVAFGKAQESGVSDFWILIALLQIRLSMYLIWALVVASNAFLVFSSPHTIHFF